MTTTTTTTTTTNAPTQVAFLGAGLMATPMIERLLAAGHTVGVWNRTRSKLAPLIAKGAHALDHPAQAAQADLVLMCLMDSAAVEASVFGEGGLTSAPRETIRARCLVDHSSIRPDATRSFARRLQADCGIAWVDAPVSGGVAGAAAGTLAIFCGGEPHAFALARPVLAAYGANINHLGPAGAGQTTKLINQVLVGSAIATIAEAVSLAQAAGIDAGALPRALAGGWADSKPLQVFVPRMVHGYDKPIGASNTMLKDLDTALDLAREVEAPLPMAAHAQQLLRTLAALGHGEDDPAALMRLYRRNT